MILTIGGAVSKANRGASNAFDDAFLSVHGYNFEQAATFDVAALERLGTVTATIKAETWPRAVTIEGSRLRDVLAAAEWNGEAITTVALDGFAVELSKADIAARDWIWPSRPMVRIWVWADMARPGSSMTCRAATPAPKTNPTGPGPSFTFRPTD